jgi:PQQ-like domain
MTWFCGLRKTAGPLACAALLLAAGSGSAYAVVLSPTSGNTGSWTVYHGDPAGDGVAPPVNTVDTTTSVWTSPALAGQIYGEPLVYADRVYVATENDYVYALSAATGAAVWSVHLGSPVPARSLPCGDITPTVGSPVHQ